MTYINKNYYIELLQECLNSGKYDKSISFHDTENYNYKSNPIAEIKIPKDEDLDKIYGDKFYDYLNFNVYSYFNSQKDLFYKKQYISKKELNEF